MRAIDNSKIIKNIVSVHVLNSDEGSILKVSYMKSYLFGLFRVEKSIEYLYKYEIIDNEKKLPNSFYKDLEYLKSKALNKN